MDMTTEKKAITAKNNMARNCGARAEWNGNYVGLKLEKSLRSRKVLVAAVCLTKVEEDWLSLNGITVEITYKFKHFNYKLEH